MVFGKVAFFRMSVPQTTVCYSTQWAIAVVLRTFGHKWSKKNDTGMVEGLLEEYYKDKLEKMIKSEFWVIVGAWDPKSKIGIFSLKSV